MSEEDDRPDDWRTAASESRAAFAHFGRAISLGGRALGRRIGHGARSLGQATRAGLRSAGGGLRVGLPAAGRAGGAVVRGAGRAARALPRNTLRLTGLVIAGGIAGVFVATALWLGAILWQLPPTDEIMADAETILSLEDSTGAPLMTRGAVPSDYAPLDTIPAHVIDAVLAIEDRRFYEHEGVDWRAVSRAAWENLTAGGIRQGGSTITQQLAKILYLTPDRTLTRKMQEALLARRLEGELGKDGVLERYLNVVYLGSGARGLPAAASVYFDRDVADLTVAQAAALAATIQSPSSVNPSADLPATQQRARLVIDLMEAQGRLEPGAADAARADLVTLATDRPVARYGSWFADWVVSEAEAIADDFDGVVTLRTSLDPALQRHAEEVIARHLPPGGPEAALVALRGDGTVAAMVGGRDYGASEFNRATAALRSPGSTFKTIVFLAALAEGYGPDTMVPDRPIEIDGYAPENFDGRYLGDITLREAFIESRNAAAVALGQQLGPERIVEAARALGIEAELSPTPAIALGADGVPLIDMVEAYAAIAANRAPITARGISGFVSTETGEFHPFRWPRPQAEGYAATLLAQRQPMLDLLQGVVTDGTGHEAAPGRPAAGKTGTGQDYRDALFIGFDEHLVVGVWVGYDDNRPMDDVTGGSLPAAIWRDFMLGLSPEGRDRVMAAPADDVAAATVAAPEPEPESAEDVEAALSAILAEASDDGPAPVDDTRALLELILDQLEIGPSSGPACNVDACRRFYRSFRESDCTFQPYGGGPRRLCER
ncbi:transglycosylase domain-containing protein [Wenxinia marina]|uniref:peptidoglycan glycosyltransferase n=1 Tax=Wenxinia marina DSM 24838 TaxID=1123501 RepID=A0A0D0PHZ6_9RHOB|nr:transglycosylase domain-containing protein [Wenxinia marina]KIQ71011.1 Membrane carboxypeptidase (penicillin-binding protein) [Wenxinia marina DSM 24838]GGL55565.1 penicillin-binding protein 1A [Wenxinia marina]